MKNIEMLEQIQRMLEENSKPLTVDEACEFMGVSKSTLYKLTHKRKIRFSKPNGRKIYFAKSDLIAWMSRNQVKTSEQIEEESVNYVTFKC
jgi:excisionase family DNA binding protein